MDINAFFSLKTNFIRKRKDKKGGLLFRFCFAINGIKNVSTILLAAMSDDLEVSELKLLKVG